MEQPASANVPVGIAIASETREDFTIYTNPLVQFPPTADVSMHPPLEGVVPLFNSLLKSLFYQTKFYFV